MKLKHFVIQSVSEESRKHKVDIYEIFRLWLNNSSSSLRSSE